MSTSFCFELLSQEDKLFSYAFILLLALAVICSVCFAIVTIYKFYIPEAMPKVLKVGSIVSTTILTLCQCFNVAVWLCRYNCYPFGYHIVTPIFAALYAIGYISLLFVFSIKVQRSAKDSIYRMSNIFICFLTMSAITFAILTIFIIVFFNTNKEELAHICIAFACIINLIAYLTLLFKLLSTLFYLFKATIILSSVNFTSTDEWISIFNQVFEFKNDNTDINSKNLTTYQNNNNAKKKNDTNDNNLNVSMIKALGIARVMIRVIVCVSIVFTSNIILLIVLVSLHVLSLHENGLMTTLLYLCYSIDLIVNNICLLYQYQFAQGSYDKNCKLCNKFLKNVIFCSIETNMKMSQKNHVGIK